MCPVVSGGAPKNGGYNWPMRGSKGTLYEGGIRQAAWVWSSLLSQDVRGQVYNGQIHLADMLPTFLGLATGGHWQPPSGKQLDGVDVRQPRHYLWTGSRDVLGLVPPHAPPCDALCRVRAGC